MIHQKVRWRLSQNDIGRLSLALKPIRSYEEVAQILGWSASLVCQLETSALRKIVRAMTALENNGESKP